VKIPLNIFKSMIRGFILVVTFCFHLQGVSVSPKSRCQITQCQATKKEVGCIIIFLFYVDEVIRVLYCNICVCVCVCVCLDVLTVRYE